MGERVQKTKSNLGITPIVDSSSDLNDYDCNKEGARVERCVGMSSNPVSIIEFSCNGEAFQGKIIEPVKTKDSWWRPERDAEVRKDTVEFIKGLMEKGCSLLVRHPLLQDEIIYLKKTVESPYHIFSFICSLKDGRGYEKYSGILPSQNGVESWDVSAQHFIDSLSRNCISPF